MAEQPATPIAAIELLNQHQYDTSQSSFLAWAVSFVSNCKWDNHNFKHGSEQNVGDASVESEMGSNLGIENDGPTSRLIYSQLEVISETGHRGGAKQHSEEKENKSEHRNRNRNTLTKYKYHTHKASPQRSLP